ncbi:Hypothetical predicted protein [Pelobates cultripes]|uniref:Uncharacterized protein n=1 Tax=Pelobates cultripes TaxID=61616 RepID=A0AAD1S2A5_PELCU|nr:Hypothetical predicted protein [Pelobates cultripes]
MGGKTPQSDCLIKSKQRGGLGLPDLEAYHKAVIPAKIYEWAHPRNDTQWVRIEANFFTTPLHVAPWLGRGPNITTHNSELHPMIPHTLQTWHKIRRDQYIAPHPSPLYPLTDNPAFLPDSNTVALQSFPKQTHTLTLGDVLNDKGIIPLEDLVPNTESSGMLRLRHSQIKHFVHSDPILLQGHRNPMLFEAQCSQHTLRRGLILL